MQRGNLISRKCAFPQGISTEATKEHSIRDPCTLDCSYMTFSQIKSFGGCCRSYPIPSHSNPCTYDPDRHGGFVEGVITENTMEHIGCKPINSPTLSGPPLLLQQQTAWSLPTTERPNQPARTRALPTKTTMKARTRLLGPLLVSFYSAKYPPTCLLFPRRSRCCHLDVP